MTEVVCKYAPVELLAGFGEEYRIYNGSVERTEAADRLLHKNLCSFSRALVECRMRSRDGDDGAALHGNGGNSNGGALLLTNCCDSMRRAGDVLRAQGQTVYMLDLPHHGDCCGREFYKKELLRFINEFSSAADRAFDVGRFAAACGMLSSAGAVAAAGTVTRTANGDAAPGYGNGRSRPQGPYIALLGARLGDGLVEYIGKASPVPVVNETCTGLHTVGAPPQALAQSAEAGFDRLMDWYAGELLGQPPCMRMSDITSRRALTEDPNLTGVIYNTVSFCDYYSFEYASLRDTLRVPMVKLETDYTTQAGAQLKNRLDAFFESLGRPSAAAWTPKEQVETGPLPKQQPWGAGVTVAAGGSNDSAPYVAGIDSGSTSTNAVILDSKGRIAAFSVLSTGVDVAESARKALDGALDKAGLTGQQILRTVATGYGRTGIRLGDREITEITCHAKGAFHLNAAVRTVIDIGGQDSKVIRLDDRGGVRDFAMNDKCAAGTGRFLEMMAQSLGVTMEEMAACGLNWKENIHITSMCSVFAQSEVVSLIAAGKKLNDIVHGLNMSVAAKVTALAGRAGVGRECMMTGGVAKNAGVVRAVEEKLAFPVCLPEEPQICGALGAALFAREEILQDKLQQQKKA